MCELTLTLLFWAWIYGLKTDVHNMTWEEIGTKLKFDLYDDVGNYNHSVPLLLLLLEFPVNNIIFTRKILAIAFVINTVYILQNWAYCIHYNVEIYDCLDWVNSPMKTFLAA